MRATQGPTIHEPVPASGYVYSPPPPNPPRKRPGEGLRRSTGVGAGETVEKEGGGNERGAGGGGRMKEGASSRVLPVYLPCQPSANLRTVAD
jgi:hypothetical protein